MQDTSRELESTSDVRETSCVVVGGGQAGAMLSLLLSRGGASVTLLESYGDSDFDRDAVHPAVMQVLEELGGIEHGELLYTLPVVLVVPAGHSLNHELRGPASLESRPERSEAAMGESLDPEASAEEKDGVFASSASKASAKDKDSDATEEHGNAGEHPDTQDLLQEENGDGPGIEQGDATATDSQFELGRAQGRIELLEQELQRREHELDELRGNP